MLSILVHLIQFLHIQLLLLFICVLEYGLSWHWTLREERFFVNHVLERSRNMLVLSILFLLATMDLSSVHRFINVEIGIIKVLQISKQTWLRKHKLSALLIHHLILIICIRLILTASPLGRINYRALRHDLIELFILIHICRYSN